jgi:transporter family-2 protein
VNWIIYVLAAAAGAANPAQAGANAELKKTLHDALPATMFVYLSGLFGILFLWLFVRQAFPDAQKFSATPWWAWTGGLLSIGATLAGAVFAQRMGSGVFTGVSVTASLVMSIILDNFGWIGFRVHPATWPRIAGCGLMVTGLWMIARL